MKKIIFGLVAALTLTSCSNKNVDDWLNQKVLEELAKIRAIAGVYRGPIASINLTSAALGELELKISPDIKPGTTADGTRTIPQAKFKGSIKHLGVAKAELSFEQGYYNPDDGTISILIPIEENSSSNPNASFRNTTSLGGNFAPKEMTINGYIRGGKLVATLEPEGFSDAGATMELVKDAPPVVTTNRPPGIGSDLVTYKGNLNASAGGTFAVTMSVSTQSVTPAIRFYNLFAPAKDIKVSMRFPRNDLYTDVGHLDTRSGIISATFITSPDGSTRYAHELNCNERTSDIIHCELLNTSRGTKLEGDLSRVP